MDFDELLVTFWAGSVGVVLKTESVIAGLDYGGRGIVADAECRVRVRGGGFGTTTHLGRGYDVLDEKKSEMNESD